MNKFYAVLLAATILVNGCTPMKLAISDDLKNRNDEYAVKGLNGILLKEKLSFGEYSTMKVKRSWTKGTSAKEGLGLGTNPYDPAYVNIIGTEYINKKQALNFSLTDGNSTSQVFCVSKFNAKDLQVGNNPNSVGNIILDLLGKGGSSESNYYVQVFISKTGNPWHLLLDNQAAQRNPKNYVGIFAKSKDEFYTINSVTKLQVKDQQRDMPFGSAGFEIRNANGKAVAAISLMDKGTVYLSKINAEERFLIANLCTALLLQQQI